ncbi:MAG: ArsR family transcriptional regulator [Candidatus Parvarchaeota archaeon]|jgi:DNA-binding transcriptional ArsR family regulator|nr:ArsR family transcriptional regulator [Candidatus Parvarchaeota archaeon]MCL5420335.1 ArsR family transcriptional regulator [Candidatus Parvarchaeota archaeon]
MVFENIFDSKIKLKILGLLAREQRLMSVSDISRVLNNSKSRISESLRMLQDSGVLESRVIGNTKVYSFSSTSTANKVKAILNEENLILAEIESKFTAACEKLKPISIVLFGSAVERLKSGSDLDILILYKDKIDSHKISDLAAKLTVESGIRVSPLILEADKFIKKARDGDDFTINVLAKYKLLYGKDPEALIWQEK